MQESLCLIPVFFGLSFVPLFRFAAAKQGVICPPGADLRQFQEPVPGHFIFSKSEEGKVDDFGQEFSISGKLMEQAFQAAIGFFEVSLGNKTLIGVIGIIRGSKHHSDF